MDIVSLNKKFNDKIIFNDVNTHFGTNNEINIIMGESGSGKSTLLNMIMGLDLNYQGSLIFNNRDIKSLSEKELDVHRSNKVGIVCQDFKLFDKLSVYENIDVASINKDKEKIFYLLDKLEIKDIQKSKIENLSGGQKQRVAIARALINTPDLLLLDEPSASLDNKNTENLIKLLKLVQKEVSCIIISTHDSRLLELADNLFEVKEKKIIQNKINGYFKEKNVECIKLNEDLYADKRSSIDIVKKVITSNKKQLKLNMSIFIILLIGIIILNSSIFMSATNKIDNYYGGISDNIIYIDLDDVFHEKENEEKNYVYFNDDVKEILKGIDGIEKVVPVNTTMGSIADINDYLLNFSIEKKSDNFINSSPNVGGFSDDIYFTFYSIASPYDITKDFYPNNDISIVSGDYPKDDSVEILIPDILAMEYFKTSNNISDFDKIIGKEIILPTKKDGKKSDNIYKVSGIYETNLKSVMAEYKVYTSYRGRGIKKNKNSYEIFKENQDEENLGVSTYDEFKKYIGGGYSELVMYIDQNKIENVHNKLLEEFPNENLRSQYLFRNGEGKDIYKSIIIGNLKLYLLAMILFMIIIYIVNKNYIYQRQKDISKLYMLGYSKSILRKSIIYETIVVNSINLFIAYGITYLIVKYILIRTPIYILIDGITNLYAILFMITFILITSIVFALISLMKIDRKNLRKFM